MVRNYIRKTNRASLTTDTIMQALRAIKYDRISMQRTSEDFKIPYRSLSRYCKTITSTELEDWITGNARDVSVGYKNLKKVNYYIILHKL